MSGSITAELVHNEVEVLRVTVDSMREAITASQLRMERLDRQAAMDAGTIRRLDAAVLTLEQRIIALLRDSEDVRVLLHEVLLWLDEAIQRNGLGDDLHDRATVLQARIRMNEAKERLI